MVAGGLDGHVGVVLLVQDRDRLAVVPGGAVEGVAGGVGRQAVRAHDRHPAEVRELRLRLAVRDLVEGLLRLEREPRELGQELAHLLELLVGARLDGPRRGRSDGRLLRVRHAQQGERHDGGDEYRSSHFRITSNRKTAAAGRLRPPSVPYLTSTCTFSIFPVNLFPCCPYAELTFVPSSTPTSAASSAEKMLALVFSTRPVPTFLSLT